MWCKIGTKVTAGNMHGIVEHNNYNEVTAGQIYKAAKTCMGMQGEGGRVHSRVRIIIFIRGPLSHCLYPVFNRNRKLRIGTEQEIRTLLSNLPRNN